MSEHTRRPAQHAPSQRGPSPRTASGRIQPARRVAYEVIRAVSESDAYANLLLPVKLERAKLHGADAGLATELSYGTLRMRGYYDLVIASASGRTIDKIDEPILDVLRLATHQLLAMRVAQHAAVDEAVTLAREVGSRSASGFVNAVLRTITRKTPEQWREEVLDAARSEDDKLAAEFSHPAWIVRAFRQSLGADGHADELRALLQADNDAPKVNLVALPGLANVDELDGAQPGRFSTSTAVSGGGDPARWPAVREGRARVQDSGSFLAALSLTRARPIVAGERWLDLCAGPGGKAAVLAAEALGGGATLVANELVPARAKLVRNALAVFADPPQVLVQDGCELGRVLAGQFDRVLLDAPCTGLGALRRRPEARWRKQPSDVPALHELQNSLLESAVAALKPGGLLAYVTCSPHPAESRVVVADALARLPLTQLNVPEILGRVTVEPLGLGAGLHAQLWPHRHDTDAMFIAVFEKNR